MNPTLKRPTAWIPVIMSLAALAVVLIHIALYGIAREADEGAVAHLFQILIAAQLPLIAALGHMSEDDDQKAEGAGSASYPCSVWMRIPFRIQATWIL